jgi:hypothetical protein
MNKAIFIFTGLAQWSRKSKADTVVLMLWFIGLIAFIHMQGNVKAVKAVLAYMTSLPILLVFGYAFGRNCLGTPKLSEAEYLALLFTRPISRASYVLTKVAVVATGLQLMLAVMVASMILAQGVNLCPKLILPDKWMVLTWIANSLSIACLSLMLNALPPRVGGYMFIFCFSVSGIGSLSYISLKLPEHYAALPIIWASLSSVLQLFNPVLDIQSSIATTTFSFAPFVNYVSNCLLYLWLAIMLLNKREFSYAQS